MDGFAIYDFPLAGGSLAISPMPGRTRHYYTDWLHLLDWRPDLVISMTAQSELDRKGAGTLGRDLANESIAWLHFPVPDMGVPLDVKWDAPRDQSLAVLRQGGKVLVHCSHGAHRCKMVVGWFLGGLGATWPEVVAAIDWDDLVKAPGQFVGYVEPVRRNCKI